MNRLAEQASLSVAVLQLQLVQSVVGAIRAADANSRADRNSGTTTRSIGPPRRLHPDAVYEPRKQVHPSPVYQAEHHHREPSAWRHWCPPVCDVEPIHSAVSPLPGYRIQPPWDLLPWPQPLPPRQSVKVYAKTSDVTAKGATLDIFL